MYIHNKSFDHQTVTFFYQIVIDLTFKTLPHIKDTFILDHSPSLKIINFNITSLDYDKNMRDYHIRIRTHTSKIRHDMVIIYFKPQNIKYTSLLTYLILNTHFFYLKWNSYYEKHRVS